MISYKKIEITWEFSRKQQNIQSSVVRKDQLSNFLIYFDTTSKIVRLFQGAASTIFY